MAKLIGIVFESVYRSNRISGGEVFEIMDIMEKFELSQISQIITILCVTMPDILLDVLYRRSTLK